jgi:hypothetical protein
MPQTLTNQDHVVRKLEFGKSKGKAASVHAEQGRGGDSQDEDDAEEGWGTTTSSGTKSEGV